MHTILASNSPQRRILLSQLGLRFSVLQAGIDESVQAGESATEYVCRMAQQKALAALQQYSADEAELDTVTLDNRTLIVAADTCMEVSGAIIGKPADATLGRDILRRLSGRTHRVLSAVCVVQAGQTDQLSESTRVSLTEVEFKHLSDKEIEDYWHTGEPLNKAGGYAIQGLGAMFIKNIRGSYSGVMGLPLYETAELLTNFGVDILRG